MEDHMHAPPQSFIVVTVLKCDDLKPSTVRMFRFYPIRVHERGNDIYGVSHHLKKNDFECKFALQYFKDAKKYLLAFFSRQVKTCRRGEQGRSF